MLYPPIVMEQADKVETDGAKEREKLSVNYDGRKEGAACFFGSFGAVSVNISAEKHSRQTTNPAILLCRKKCRHSKLTNL